MDFVLFFLGQLHIAIVVVKKNPSVELKGVFRDQSCYGVFRETIMDLYYVLED